MCQPVRALSCAVGGEYASIIVPGAARTLTDADLDSASAAFRRSRFVLAQLRSDQTLRGLP